jgi:hypothetical protein
VDCQWIEKHLEAYFSDALAAADTRLFKSHLESCATCSENVRGLQSIDPLVKKLFRQNLAIAQTGQRRRSPVVLGGFAAVAAAIIIIVVMRFPTATPVTPAPAAPPAVASTNIPPTPVTPKVPDGQKVERAKPDWATAEAPKVPPSVPAKVGPDGKAPAFIVMDPAGYSRTLKDYRNYVLIVGVWSADQPQTASSLERIYQTFGPNTKLRILGVANDRRPAPGYSTFPTAFNQGSALLGATSSEYVIVDPSGTVRKRGSLLQDSTSLIKSIRTTLTEIGVQ